MISAKPAAVVDQSPWRVGGRVPASGWSPPHQQPGECGIAADPVVDVNIFSFSPFCGCDRVEPVRIGQKRTAGQHEESRVEGYLFFDESGRGPCRRHRVPRAWVEQRDLLRRSGLLSEGSETRAQVGDTGTLDVHIKRRLVALGVVWASWRRGIPNAVRAEPIPALPRPTQGHSKLLVTPRPGLRPHSGHSPTSGLRLHLRQGSCGTAVRRRQSETPRWPGGRSSGYPCRVTQLSGKRIGVLLVVNLSTAGLAQHRRWTTNFRRSFVSRTQRRSRWLRRECGAARLRARRLGAPAERREVQR
jgi:hypothetical protein